MKTPMPPPGQRPEASSGSRLRHFDFLSVAGLLLALGAILFGQSIDGGELSTLFNLPALVIVLGGTIGAVLLQSPLNIFRRALRRLSWVLFPPDYSREAMLEKVIHWSVIARSEGFIGLENLLDDERNAFCAKALRLLVQGSEPDDIRYALEIELNTREDIEYRSIRVFEGMGSYAPTISIIGSVLGLMHVMNNLTDPAELGAGIAAAFVATIYGVGLANLVFLPIAGKIKNIVQQQSQLNEMVIEGAIAIARGDNPRNVATRLQGFMLT